MPPTPIDSSRPNVSIRSPGRGSPDGAGAGAEPARPWPTDDPVRTVGESPPVHPAPRAVPGDCHRLVDSGRSWVGRVSGSGTVLYSRLSESEKESRCAT